MIAVIDYRRGNIRSVAKALEFLGFNTRIIQTPEEGMDADRIILPGVGAFQDGMEQLNKLGFTEFIKDRVKMGVPFLGICLGLQLLFESSEESTGIEGLSLLKGKVLRFQGNFKIPHMGWNQMKFRKNDLPVFQNIQDESYFYFVHSYKAHPEDKSIIIGTTDYYSDVTCAVQKENITAFQFHPEKSQDSGLKLLKNWVELC